MLAIIMKKNAILIITLLIVNFGFTQNKPTITDVEIEIFSSMFKLKCKGNSAMHSYINNLGIFYMAENNNSQYSTYKLESKYSAIMSVSIYNDIPGFRFETTKPNIYNYLIESGTFKETHREGKVLFLVYTIEGEDFLLNKSDYKGTTYYLIDTYCYD